MIMNFLRKWQLRRLKKYRAKMEKKLQNLLLSTYSSCIARHYIDELDKKIKALEVAE